jgi:RimJ/RimL family protein N-acetyltransferase
LEQLRPEQYSSVCPLCAPLDDHLVVPATLAGAVPGWVYVDDPARPTAALLGFKARYHLAGDAHNGHFNAALRGLFAEQIYPRGRESGGMPMFVLDYAPGWEESIPAILQGRDPISDMRQYWECAALPTCCPPLPEEYTLRPVDRSLLAEAGLENLDALREEMCSERMSEEEFMRHSFGLCALREREIACWSLSEYNLGERCEVGIETVAAYRRRGLGAATAGAMVVHAFAQGIRRVGWHCWQSNVASQATAARAGLHKAHDYPVFFAWFDEVDNLAVNGNVRLRAGDCQGAVPWFERALASGRAGGWVYWQAGVAYAGLGQGELALASLRGALERGFGDAQRLRDAAELQSLRGTAGWDKLLADL